MADEADPSRVLAAKGVGFRAAYRLASRRVKRQFGSTECRVFSSLNPMQRWTDVPPEQYVTCGKDVGRIGSIRRT